MTKDGLTVSYFGPARFDFPVFICVRQSSAGGYNPTCTSFSFSFLPRRSQKHTHVSDLSLFRIILHRPAQHPSSTGRCHLHRHPHRWPNTARAAYPTGRSPSARARQAGTRICQDEGVLRDSPVLARLVKRSPNELLCGTSII